MGKPNAEASIVCGTPGHLPDDLVYRRKVGFGTPLTGWFRNTSGLGRYLELLLEPSARTSGYFDHSVVSRLVSEHGTGSDDHSEAIWGLLALELWLRQVVERAAPGDHCGSWQEERINLVPVSLLSSSASALHSGMTV